MSSFAERLKIFLHDPVDKCLDIPGHIKRAEVYTGIISISGIDEVKGPDWIASCMEQSLIPKGISQSFNQIKHPLSEGKISISFENQEVEEIFSVVKEAFKEIEKEINSYDDEIKFLYLWRNLLDVLVEKSGNKAWCKYLPLFPADTRVPDHSIWEHLKVASSIYAIESNGLLQNNSLFLFTIGPVQSFISQARKTQDFYIGSFILSYLTFTGMRVIINKYAPTSIIYPDLYNQPLADWFLQKEKNIQVRKSNLGFIDIPTIPNRFVAIIPTTSGEEIKKIAEEMKQNIFKELANIQDKILGELSLNVNIKNTLKGQIENFFQIYWVAIPWKKGENETTIEDLKDFFEIPELNKWHNIWNFAGEKGEHKPNIGLIYQLLYTALEKSMGARKNLREFRQFVEKGRKCSVCGERNVLFFRETKNKNKFKKCNPEAIDLTGKISPKYLSDGEGLCGLCFIKRTFEIYLEENVDQKFKDLSFPSTAEIALADFKNKALEKAKKELKEYEELLKDFPIVSPVPKLINEMPKTLDGEWFFEENLRKEFIKRELNIDLTDEDIERLKRSLKNLVEKTGKPNPYYAIIYLDGDNMGKWLSGELLPEIENAYNSETWGKFSNNFKEELKKNLLRKPLTPAIHSSISTALRNYSIEFVKKIVEEEHRGKLVYAGGDDVLAFLNLKDLIDVMEKLRFAFSGEIKFENGVIKVDIENNTGFVEKDNRCILTMGKNATASMGVVIAHYKEPFKVVLNKVFEMEKRSKSSDKDSFSILLMKKSGEERIATYKWRYNNILTTDVIRKAKEAMDDEQKRYISNNFIQKLKKEFMRLKEGNGHLLISQSIFDASLQRLLCRAYNFEGGRDNKEEKAKFIKEFHTTIKDLFWGSDGNIDKLTNLLEIASFLNKGD